MHGSGGMDCQSAISTIPAIVQKIPEIAMIRLSNLSLCSSSLQSNERRYSHQSCVLGGVPFCSSSEVESFIVKVRVRVILANKNE